MDLEKHIAQLIREACDVGLAASMTTSTAAVVDVQPLTADQMLAEIQEIEATIKRASVSAEVNRIAAEASRALHETAIGTRLLYGPSMLPDRPPQVGGVRIIQDPNCLEETEERLFPVSKNRSKRIHKKLVKRFGGEFRKVPTIWRMGRDTIVCHPSMYAKIKAAMP